VELKWNGTECSIGVAIDTRCFLLPGTEWNDGRKGSPRKDRKVDCYDVAGGSVCPSVFTEDTSARESAEERRNVWHSPFGLPDSIAHLPLSYGPQFLVPRCLPTHVSYVTTGT
jgi:hypothetical protein